MRIPDFPDLPRMPDNVEIHLNAHEMTGWPNTPRKHQLERVTRIANRVINHQPVTRDQMVQNLTYFVCRNIFISQHIATRKFNLWRAEHPSPQFPQDKLLELAAAIHADNPDTIGLAVMPDRPITNLDPAYVHPEGLLITALARDQQWMGYQPALSYLKELQAIVIGSAQHKQVIAILAAPASAFQSLPLAAPFPGGEANVLRSLLTWHGATTHWITDEDLYNECLTEDEEDQDGQNLVNDPDFDPEQQPDAALSRMLAQAERTGPEQGRPPRPSIVTFKEISNWPNTMSEARTRAALEAIAQQTAPDRPLVYRAYPDPADPPELTDTQILRVVTDSFRLNQELCRELYELQDKYDLNDDLFHQQVLELAQRGCSNTSIGLALVREEEVNGRYITFHQVARHPDGMGILPELAQMKGNTAMVYESLATGLPAAALIIPPYTNPLPDHNHPFPAGPATALAQILKYHGMQPYWIPQVHNPAADPGPDQPADQKIRAVEQNDIGADWPYRPSRSRLHAAARRASLRPVSSHQLDQIVAQPKDRPLTDAQQYQELQKQVSDNNRLSRQYALLARKRPSRQEHFQLALSLAATGNTNHTMGLAVIVPNPDQPGALQHGFHRITRNRQWIGFNRLFKSIAGATALIVGDPAQPDPVALLILPEQALPPELPKRPLHQTQQHQDLRLLMEWHRAQPCYIQLDQLTTSKENPR